MSENLPQSKNPDTGTTFKLSDDALWELLDTLYEILPKQYTRDKPKMLVMQSIKQRRELITLACSCLYDFNLKHGVLPNKINELPSDIRDMVMKTHDSIHKNH